MISKYITRLVISSQHSAASLPRTSSSRRPTATQHARNAWVGRAPKDGCSGEEDPEEAEAVAAAASNLIAYYVAHLRCALRMLKTGTGCESGWNVRRRRRRRAYWVNEPTVGQEGC